MPGLSLSDQPLKTPKPVKPPSGDQILSQLLSNPEEGSTPTCPAPKDFRKPAMTDQHSLDSPDLTCEPSGDTRVREPGSPPDGGDVATDTLTAPAHPSDRLVLQLSERWRIVDDPLQWILQRKKGTPSKKNSGWQNRSFCRTREGLLRCIREYCGDEEAESLALLQLLSDFHPDWEKSQ